MLFESHAAVGVSTHSLPRTPTTNTSRHESWADLVRVLAAFLIVAIHVLHADRQLSELPPASFDWVVVALLTAATRWALPIFIMTSGYFLLDPNKRLDWRSYYRRRAGRIGWPLLAWTVLYLSMTACDNLLAGRPIGLAKMPEAVIRGIPYYHLWYLYMLPGLYLCAPFLKAATDHLNPAQLTAAVLMCFLVTAMSAALNGLYSVPSATYIDDFPRYIGYFLAGHLFGRVRPPAKPMPAVLVMAISAVATTAASWIVAEDMSPARALQVFGFANPMIITLSLAAFVVVRRIRIGSAWNGWLARAGETSLGIYLVHPAIIDVLPYRTLSLPMLAIEVLSVFIASLLIVIVAQHAPVLRRCV